MPRTCFVIMPFSTTESCSEEEWNYIFENVLKPSIEGAGLHYICRRSVATRGNIVGAILRDLNDSHVVLADLTDRNANVFYELGVRHTLKDRSILIAQRQEDIPFDLQAYAYHVYGWRTREGIEALAQRMKQLLLEIDSNPERPDNPVSDFLGVRDRTEAEPVPEVISPTEVAVAQPLVGTGADGIDIQRFVKGLVERGRSQEAKTILRLTRAQLVRLTDQVLKSLHEREAPGQVTRDKILERAKEYIAEVGSVIKNVEDFGLACIQESWQPGVEITLKLSGNLISISEKPRYDRVIRYAQGAPSLMAWRMLCLCGAKALDDDELELVSYILREPIEVEEASGRFSNRPLIARRDLFYPEAFLGYANLAMQYMDRLWDDNPHLSSYFDSDESYQLALAKFFVLVVLAASPDERNRPLYPGYRLLKQAERAMSSLTGRMFSSPDYFEKMAQTIGTSGADLMKDWTERTKLINSVSAGAWHPLRHEVPFPEEFGEDIR